MSSKKKQKNTAAANDRKRLLTNESPFAIKEAYVKLRTNLMFCMTADKKKACRIFEVTSANPNEGKSLTAANIAVSFAMLGKETLLIDADLRKPTQRKLWKIKAKTGLCDFLADIAPMELIKVADLPLSIITAGTIPPNPSELLSSEVMKTLISNCAARYDYIIIDTPPVNTVADAQMVATFVDGVILVAKSGSTTSDELQTAMDAIQRAGGNLCGTVLNDMSMKATKKYSYRYSEAYAAYETK